MISAKDAAGKQRLRFEMRRKNPRDVYGIPTGLPTLDKMTGGIQRKEVYKGESIGDNDLYVLIADTGSGKSSLAGQFTLHIAEWFSKYEPEKEVRLYAGEMGPELYQDRLMSNLAGIPLKRILTGEYISKEQEERYYESLKVFETLPIRYVEHSPDMRTLANELVVKKIEGKSCGFFVIDHLHITPGITPENKVSSIGHNANIIHEMVKRFVPGLVLGQMNKDALTRQDKHPQMTDVSYDSVLKQASTVFLGLYRGDMYQKVPPEMQTGRYPADLDILKSRIRGETGRIELTFIKDRGVWEEV